MFPAYGNDDLLKKVQRDDRDNEAPSCSYSSFKTVNTSSITMEKSRENVEPQRSERKRKKHHKLLKQKAFEMDFVDDSEGIDVDSENMHKSKKKHKKRKEERRKSSSEYSESKEDTKEFPSTSQILAQNIKWTFLTPNWSPNVPSSFVVNDCNKVSANLFYDYLQRKEVPVYHTLLNQLFGGSDELNQVMFPASVKSKKQKRYFSDKVFNAWNENPEKCETLGNNISFSGYTTLDSLRSETKHEDDKLNGVTRLNKISEIEAKPEIRSMLYNKRLKSESHDIDLWMRFVAVQDEIYLEKCGVEDNKKNESKKNCLTDKALLERKIDILDKASRLCFQFFPSYHLMAVQKNPQSVKLKLERLKIGCYLWDDQKLEQEIRNIQFYHVNDPEMWTGVFDLMESDIRRFSFNKMIKSMQRAIEQLSAIMKGSIVTHPALPGTEMYLVSVMIRMIRLMFDSGYSERAVGCAQAFCEYNICCPPNFPNDSSKQKLEAFQTFWNSGVARIGDYGAKGWARSIDDLNTGRIATDRDEIDKSDRCREKEEFVYANSLDANGKKRSLSELWNYTEALRQRKLWRPVRDRAVELDDNDRYVSIHDVNPMLVTLSADAVLTFLFDVLNLFGASIYGQEDISTDNIFIAFGNFPLHLFKRYEGFDDFIGRFMKVAAFYLPDNAARLRSSVLLTKYQLMLNAENVSQENMLKVIRSEGKVLISDDPNNKSVWATFAEQLMKFDNKEYSRKIALSWLKEKNIWSSEISERITLLRLVVVFLLISDRKRWSNVLEKLFIDGVVADKVDEVCNNAGVIAEKRYNHLLVEAIERNFVSWEGSEVDLLATLILLYNARASDGNTSLKKMRFIYDNILRNVHVQKLPVFMKHYVGLLHEHLNTYKNTPPKLLYTELQHLIKVFPRNIGFLKDLIDTSCLGRRVYDIQNLLNEPTNDSVTEIYRGIGLVYFELNRYRLQTICFEAQYHNVEKLCHTLQSVSQRLGNRYDLFWRLLLFIRSEREELERCRETFYLSQSVCPWSKALILDYAKVDPEQYTTLLSLMEEKCLRIHCQKEEVPLLGFS
uniref:Golgi to ER traffic-protein n=1 Tax=Syphacia muris TaxID=451379 RepID=A0A158R5N0_9BILA